MRKNIIYSSLSLIAAAAIMTGCGGRKSVAETETNTAVKVKTEKVTLEEIEDKALFTSDIEAIKSNNIAPSTPSRIDKILVDVGSTVRKGQLLVKMDPAQYNQIAVQLANTQADYDRTSRVYAAGGVSKQQIDQLTAQLDILKTQEANLRMNTDLVSPIDGVVTARNYHPGDLYSGAPILTVMQINTLKVTLSLSERYFPDVKIGMPAEISVDMFPDKTYKGSVSLIYPAIDPMTRTFVIEISIPNPKLELRPGMFSRTTLNFGTNKGIMVKDVAVQKQLGTNDKYVYVVNGNTTDKHLVTTGVQIGNMVEILTGIQPGDEVITEGISRLDQGTAIQVVNK